MKTRWFFKWFVILLLLTGAFPVGAQAPKTTARQPHAAPSLSLQPETNRLAIGRAMVVSLWIEDAPLVYGAQGELSFDSALVEIVDANLSQSGVQVTSGTFFDPGKSTVIRNLVDNLPNTIDYAVSLLYPAPEVSGRGTLLTLTLRGKQAGITQITASGALGTTSGATIDLLPAALEIQVVDQSFIYLPAIRR